MSEKAAEQTAQLSLIPFGTLQGETVKRIDAMFTLETKAEEGTGRVIRQSLKRNNSDHVDGALQALGLTGADIEKAKLKGEGEVKRLIRNTILELLADDDYIASKTAMKCSVSKKGKKTFTVSLKQASESTPDVSKMAQALGLSEEEVRAMIRRQRENLHKMTLEAQEVEESDIEATEPEPEPEPVQPVKMPRRAAKV